MATFEVAIGGPKVRSDSPDYPQRTKTITITADSLSAATAGYIVFNTSGSPTAAVASDCIISVIKTA